MRCAGAAALPPPVFLMASAQVSKSLLASFAGMGQPLAADSSSSSASSSGAHDMMGLLFGNSALHQPGKMLVQSNTELALYCAYSFPGVVLTVGAER